MRGALWTVVAVGALAALGFALPSGAQAQRVFYKVTMEATTSTFVPGKATFYEGFNDAAATQGLLVFEGFDAAGASGIGAIGTTTHQFLAPGPTGTPIVETVFKFYRPNPVGDGLAFLAETIEPPGVAIGVIPDAFDPVASETVSLNFEKITWEYKPTDPAPSPLSGVFLKISDIDGDAERLVFHGTTVDGEGVYHLVPGTPSPTVERIADTTTLIPKAPTSMSFTGFGDVGGNANFAVFHGFGDLHEGVYFGEVIPKVEIDVVADTSTSVPTGSGSFKGFLKVEIEQTAVSFVGLDQNDWPGIFSFDFVTKQLTPLIDVKTAVPAPGQGFFKTIEALSLSDKSSPALLLFLATDEQGRRAAYQATLDKATPKLQEVLAEGSHIDGKQVTSIGLGEDGMGSIALTLGFDDQSSGVASIESSFAVPLLPRVALALLLMSAGVALVLSLRARTA